MTSVATEPDVVVTPAPGVHEARSRYERLLTRVSTLRRRRSVSGDRWLLLAGSVLMPLGAVVVLLGWLGAAKTPLVFEQIPYLISGGVLGLAFVFAGGFVYFAYWQTLALREARLAREELASSLRRIEEALVTGAAPGVSTSTVHVAQASPLVATATGSLVHRPDCVIVANRDNLRSVAADTPGLSACRLCDPLDDAAQS